MPPLPAPAKVLVTGASGFLAVHVVRALLDQGYTVVGTVRSSPKGDYLVNLFKSDKFSYAIVQDIEKDDAFDQVVKSGNFDAIEHTASPFHLHADDPNELIGPAVRGTTNILRTAQQFGSSVKRVVITSSVSAIMEPQDQVPYTFTESDWNETSPREVEQHGVKASSLDKYNASKTLAERAAWAFMSESSGKLDFDLVVINPPFIFGPVIHQFKDINALNQSNALLRKALRNSAPDPDAVGAFLGNFIDVRTVADAHVKAIQVAGAAGNRFIISAGPFSWQDAYDALNDAKVEGVPKGHPGSQQVARYNLQDGSKARLVLGVEYWSLQKTLVDTVNSLRERFPNEL